jgi:hypothetical protein
MTRDQSIREKARKIIILIKREMKNAFARKNILSRNVHTSSNPIENENERRTKM